MNTPIGLPLWLCVYVCIFSCMSILVLIGNGVYCGFWYIISTLNVIYWDHIVLGSTG